MNIKVALQISVLSSIGCRGRCGSQTYEYHTMIQDLQIYYRQKSKDQFHREQMYTTTTCLILRYCMQTKLLREGSKCIIYTDQLP